MLILLRCSILAHIHKVPCISSYTLSNIFYFSTCNLSLNIAVLGTIRQLEAHLGPRGERDGVRPVSRVPGIAMPGSEQLLRIITLPGQPGSSPPGSCN